VAKHGVLGLSFDHMHMGDLLREVASHPDAEIAGVFDPTGPAWSPQLRHSPFHLSWFSPTLRPA
jgi:hypothetical protein